VRYCPSCHSVFPNEFRTCPKDQAELLTASELQPGMVLRGKYEILGKLGAGGMAAVYRARHLAFGEVRAIKVVNNRLADDEDFLRRFRHEAVVARRLQHPNAVRVDDLDVTEDGRPFIVMEYVEGRNLREVIRHEGALSLRRSVRIARQVASALAAAHELGIVHRDIKPDNILLTGKGDAETAKVLDFGIAKMKESAVGDSGAVATRTGMVVGTPQYISPEQAMGRRGSDLDGRADLYSLGVVLYEMVTGRLPFESDTAMGIILHHLQTPPPSPRDVRPDLGIPEPLSDVLLRALEKLPEKRFASAAAMSVALDELLALPLPEREPAAPGTAGAADYDRPLTPRPIPADIDRHETRVMPKTPPVTGLPDTPRPTPTLATSALPSAPTPLPSPTILTPARGTAGAGRGTPPPLPLPGPLPASTTVFAAPGVRRGKRRWWIGLVAAAVVFSVLRRDRGRRHAAEDTPASPSPSVSATADPDESAARVVASDTQIQASIQKALRSNGHTRRHDIDVEVDEGFVTLSGTAPVAVAKEAEALTRRVEGVRDVVNAITEGEEGSDASKSVAPVAPVAPISPPIPMFGPHGPQTVPGRPPADAQTVKRLLREAQEALHNGNPGEAMGKFAAVLSMDGQNEEAKAGMTAATLRFTESLAQRIRGLPSPPS
jgi:serine/threonine protein kinase